MGREAQIDAARDCFYRGFFAAALGAYLETTAAMDAYGERRKGVLSADDLATWSASYEAPLSYDYGDWRL